MLIYILHYGKKEEMLPVCDIRTDGGFRKKIYNIDIKILLHLLMKATHGQIINNLFNLFFSISSSVCVCLYLTIL